MNKNFRKIPEFILAKLSTIGSEEVLVSTLKNYNQEEIKGGCLSHLGISMDSDGIVIPDEYLPNRNQGKYSKRNIDGFIITRKDLPKYPKTIDCGERPIWGDYSKGTFTLYVTKLVYHKDFIPPRELTISSTIAEVINEPNQMFKIKFSVNQVLNKQASDFEEALLFNINLLQENVGKVDVFASDASLEEYLKTTLVNWEILPPGKRDETINKILVNYRTIPKELITRIQERYDFFISLNPQEILIGSNGFRRYFGAKFKDNLVAFENLDYGNAVYVMFENWQDLSKCSRLELLKRTERDFVRVLHSENWQKNIQHIIKKRLAS